MGDTKIRSKKPRKHQPYRTFEVLYLTGVPGIEPGSGVLETLILPMNYTPI